MPSEPAPTLSNAPPSQGSEMKKIHIYDLPSEAQKEIFKHATSADLISLSLVSKQFRDLAAQELYRNFHIVFPDDDDPTNDSSIDGLAGGLDTFVTSEYDYAKHLREIALYTLSGGDKAERAYRSYLYSLSCGKFLNTLLRLTLRKAKSLETFRWDIRVELDRQVFKALHQIPSLTHVHLRMQIGSSQYEPPPPLPALEPSGNVSSTVMPPLATIFSHPPPASMFPLISSSAPPTLFPRGNSFILGKNASKLKFNAKGTTQDPPTISGFRNLKTLSIVDLDTLDYLTEIKTCIRNSSHTLNKLKLSFAEALASKSRKPPPEIPQDDDSDQDVDDFNGPLPGPSDDVSGPAKAYRAQEERKTQEAFLGKLFGLSEGSTKSKIAKSDIPTTVEDKSGFNAENAMAVAEFVKDLRNAATKYLSSIAASENNKALEESSLAKVLSQTKNYLAEMKKKKDNKLKELGVNGAASSATMENSVAPAGASDKISEASSSMAALLGEALQTEPVMSGAANVEQSILFDESQNDEKKAVVDAEEWGADEIKVDEPETNELAIEEGEPPVEAHTDAEDTKPKSQDDSSAKPSIESSATHVSVSNNDAAPSTLEITEDEKALSLPDDVEQTRRELQTLRQQISAGFVYTDSDGCRVTLEDVEDSLAMVEDIHLIRTKRKDPSSKSDHFTQTLQKDHSEAYARFLDNKVASEYLRETRGLMLETLSIYLIPIKASILSRAIDLTVLQNITLLNCGPQAPFWNMVAKENRTSPLPLCKIYTDNVTLPFLSLVSQLTTVTELYLLERIQKSRTESFAAKTTVTIEQIRKLVLKKHASTLRVLKIKNETNFSWDINEKTALLLCRRAKLLRELAICFGVRVMHTLLQHLPGLSNLRALHIIQFRTDDTCMWVMREVPKFTIDAVSQNPDLKLEYLALDTTVERLVRRVNKPKSKTSKSKGKTKTKLGVDIAELTWDSAIGGSASGSVVDGVDGSSTDESDEDENGIGKTGLVVETIEGIHFHDLTGVNIFMNEILLGRL